MSDAPKRFLEEQLALQLMPVVPDGTPRQQTAPAPSERDAPPPPGAALWFDDPDTRYVLH